VAYAKTVATGFVAATQPGSTITAPSDEATLRAAGDATVLSAITDKIDSVSGTANRVTIGGTATAPTVDIASTYAGQASINTLGTVTTGVWNGSAIDTAHTAAKVVAVARCHRPNEHRRHGQQPDGRHRLDLSGPDQHHHARQRGTGTWNATTIAANKGGTGLTGFGQAGALLIAASIAALAVLNPNVTATKKFLNQIGDGAAVTATAWSPIVSADVSDATSLERGQQDHGPRQLRERRRECHLRQSVLRSLHVGNLTGNVTGNVTGTLTGDVVGNAATATKLLTARTINGVSFDGSGNITVTAAAGTLSGSTIAATVTASSLTSVGTLTSLAVTGIVTLGNAIQLPGNGAAAVQARNASNSAYVDLLFLNASDVAVIPRAAVISTGLTVAAGTTAVQALTATTGVFSGGVATISGSVNPNLRLNDGTGDGFVQVVAGDINISPRAGKSFTVSGAASISSGLTVSSGTTAVQALTATTGTFSSNVTATRYSTTTNNAAALVLQNAAGHNAGLLGNRLDITGSGSADDAILCAFGTVGLVPGNGTTSALTLNTDLSAAFAGDIRVNTNKFTVAAASGNTAIAGILTVSGGQIVVPDVASNSNGVDLTFHNGASLVATLSAANALATFVGSVKTSNPTTGTAANWRLGSRVVATVALVTSQYIELDVNGTLYKLATVS
jgi:hypothetical protein